MTWVVALTASGPVVELDALARNLPHAVVNGRSEWETRPEAHAAMATYRARLAEDDRRAAGQADLFGGSHD